MTIRMAVILLSFSALLFACGDGGGGNGDGNGDGGIGGEGGIGGIGGGGGTGGMGGEGGTGGTGGGLPSHAVNGLITTEEGVPMSGVTILVNRDFLRPATTGVDGKFRFDDVEPPYDLTVAWEGMVIELRGLRRLDPVLPLNGELASFKAADLAGSVIGTTYPLVADDHILVGATGRAFQPVGVDAVAGSFQGRFIWFGSAKRTADLVAVRVTSTASGIEFHEFGKRPGLNLEAGIGQMGYSIELTEAVETSTTAVTTRAGAYADGAASGLFSFTVGGARFMIPGTQPLGPTPLLPTEGAVMAMQGKDADGNMGAHFVSAKVGGSTRLELPETPALELVLPAVGSTASTLPTLTWTPVSGAAAYWVQVESRTFVLPGTSTSLTLPDYGVLGAALKAGTDYDWTVVAFEGPGFGADEVTDGSGEGLYRFILVDDELRYFSSSSKFTTAD